MMNSQSSEYNISDSSCSLLISSYKENSHSKLD